MFIFALITIIPTMLCWIILKKVGLHFKSKYLMLVFSWFTGVYLFTFSVFLLAILYTPISSMPLLFATYSALLLWILGLCFFFKDLQKMLSHLIHLQPEPKDILFISFCFLFSVVFFTPHLAMKAGMIYSSPIYWDFHWHVAVIQNFVLGNNFPPQNETISGIPMTYHFFGYFLFAIYSTAGLTLIQSLTWGSVLIFTMILLGLIGTGEEITKSKWPGFFAVLLMITSSSAHFISYFAERQNQAIPDIITDIFKTTAHPWTLSFIPGSPENYSGILFNLFYLLAERHMIIGFVFLLFSFWIIYLRKNLTKKVLLILGGFLGAYFLWHLYISIMVLCALLFLLLLDKEKEATLYLLAGFLLIFGLHYLVLKDMITQFPEFAKATDTYPRFNADFARIAPNIPTLSDALSDWYFHYRFAYGLKLLLLPIAFVLLWKKQKQIALTLMAIIIPTFFLIHTVQLSPGEIGENHKWLRPMNLIIDIAVAIAVFKLFFIKKHFFRITAGILCLFFLTISGVIELMPFINSKSTIAYKQYPSALTKAIWNNSSANAVFLGDHTREILLAGRKIYVGDISIGAETAYNKKHRLQIMNYLYTTADKKLFCDIARSHRIDFIEESNQKRLVISLLPAFTTTDSEGRSLWFIDTKDQCKTL